MRAFVGIWLIVGLAATSGSVASANEGKSLFEQKCASCHSIGGGEGVGPDLKDVTKRREHDWLLRWITVPDQMLAAQDPIATELLARFNQIPMPNLGVSEAEAEAMLVYIASQSEAISREGAASAGADTGQVASRPPRGWTVQRLAGLVFLILAILIALVFWRTIASTREPVPKIDMDEAYALRRKIFVAATIFVVGTLAATLSRTPYAGITEPPDHVIYATAKQFSFVYSAEPITSEKELAEVPTVFPLTIPNGALVEFRVTSLDVNHGFAIYTPSGDVLTQTQAMPGYTNRLRVRFPAPGKYPVLCLEYCGLPHHLMRSEFTVE